MAPGFFPICCVRQNLAKTLGAIPLRALAEIIVDEAIVQVLHVILTAHRPTLRTAPSPQPYNSSSISTCHVLPAGIGMISPFSRQTCYSQQRQQAPRRRDSPQHRYRRPTAHKKPSDEVANYLPLCSCTCCCCFASSSVVAVFWPFSRNAAQSDQVLQHLR